MLRWILLLIFLSLLLRAVNRVFSGVIEGMRGIEGKRPAAPATPLVRDPVCGTYVVPANSISAGTGAQMRFFCSENCRRIYQAKQG